MEIAKAYEPKVAEESHYQRWEANGFFAPEINKDPDAPKYSIVIPPPNVTGSLHMGHALQHTIMDVLTRWKRMQGYRTLWLPGTDHAGISVQRKVVEQLKKDENKSPLDIGREEFIKRAWTWKEQFGNTITEQMRREGASVDWSRERFTMDESLSLAVRNVFCTLYDEGWIYRGLRIVNWCPKDKTVLSDLEVKEETKKDGKLYYLRYPVSSESRLQAAISGDKEPSKDGTHNIFIVVATTRPETMLGDTAVAVSPSDERYKDLIGKMIALPLTDRQIPIIADEYVDAEFGTGAVKITPAHDPNDYLVGQRHDLPQLLIMNDDGTMNADAGAAFDGMDRFEARKKVIADFEELGLLEKIDDYELSLPVCERCKTIVEPILSDQWFVKMDEMRDMALELMRSEGVPHFSPQVPHEKVYTAWLDNLKDWTISRQLWWGHQIPAWYDEEGNVYVARTADEAKEKAGGKELKQDQDVLDTWFSSGLWAFSTFGWNGESSGDTHVPMSAKHENDLAGGTGVGDKSVAAPSDLDTFLPTDVLVTGRDIIFLWVSRMIMLTKKFTGKKAFEDVVVTGTVLGKDGKPMSKSRNNGVDPLEMFDKFGVDATRIYLASIATGADIKWNDVGVETYRNFANKIWNATRFCLLNSDGASVEYPQQQAEQESREMPPKGGTQNLADKWILSRFNKTAIDVNKALSKYEFHTAVSLLYHFFWDDFCDWYIELKKDEINAGDIVASSFILSVLERSLRLLHPFMPYLTEELWHKLPGVSSGMHNAAYADAGATIMLADFPKGDTAMIDEKAEAEIQRLRVLISKVRHLRSFYNIKPSDKVVINFYTDDLAKFQGVILASDIKDIFNSNINQILKLARASCLNIFSQDENFVPPKGSANDGMIGGVISIPLEGLIDFKKERSRLGVQIQKLDTELERLSGQLSNADFVNKAPAEKVDALQERKTELEQQILTFKTNFEALVQ